MYVDRVFRFSSFRHSPFLRMQKNFMAVLTILSLFLFTQRISASSRLHDNFSAINPIVIEFLPADLILKTISKQTSLYENFDAEH